MAPLSMAASPSSGYPEGHFSSNVGTTRRLSPGGIAIIGTNASGDGYAQHYFDSRSVARVYEMDVKDGVWSLWREGSDFSQRFRGTFSDDGRTITADWERSDDGSTWQHDFQMTYRKVGD
ncbi:MAG: hypothetical protein IT305_24395 [Chloroflexi bacterium]|nr:hypothetical protein [Chloroflexota bacterium]